MSKNTTCTPKEVMEQELKEQNQETDLDEDFRGYLADLRAGNAKLAYLLSIVGKKPMDGDQILEGFIATRDESRNFKLRCFTEGVRYAERHLGIGGGDE